ncbi:hypothetical protein HAX54_013957 [Datura stramonium]|uniref:Uncharacterized protein n=1 Tax=Datura stramonium TaxID=4076 RepID=A0ABS8TN67_DATST|nr:hypothetical protein [Datura stramonium]
MQAQLCKGLASGRSEGSRRGAERANTSKRGAPGSTNRCTRRADVCTRIVGHRASGCFLTAYASRQDLRHLWLRLVQGLVLHGLSDAQCTRLTVLLPVFTI